LRDSILNKNYQNLKKNNFNLYEYYINQVVKKKNTKISKNKNIIPIENYLFHEQKKDIIDKEIIYKNKYIKYFKKYIQLSIIILKKFGKKTKFNNNKFELLLNLKKNLYIKYTKINSCKDFIKSISFDFRSLILFKKYK
jgi:hypothetical protein